jgi:phosphoribosylformimino-5-aminoimidazole carboxamide ribotide isomerase
MKATWSKFRPCIDLHDGRVKQIVGGTLSDSGDGLRTNFVSDRPAAYYADRYRSDGLTGGHVIKLGPGNEDAALESLRAYPDGLQLGGGITPENAETYLAAGASHVIVTSYLFVDGHFSSSRLAAMVAAVGTERLVLDLSCRQVGEGWHCAMDRWQTVTDLAITPATLDELAPSCAEFLVHAADVEGRCGGIDAALVRALGEWEGRPITYAGGVRSLEDLALISELSAGRVDATIGSALDLFGGSLVTYADCLAWNRRGQLPGS